MTIALYPVKDTLQAALLQGGTAVKRAEVDTSCGNEDDLADQIVSALEDPLCRRVICPGGALKPLMPGVYHLGDKALEDAASGRYGKHPYNRCMTLCHQVARRAGDAQPLMAHPLSCDELLTLNRTSSRCDVPKRSRYYALEHRAAVAEYTQQMDITPEECNLIVCKIDDDVSVGAHMRGMCVEVNDVLGIEGPAGFACTGDLPVASLTARFFEAGMDLDGMTETLQRRGGVSGYAGTDDPLVLESIIREGDRGAETAAQLVAYQTAKWVGMCALSLGGQVDAVLVLGKGALCPTVMDALSQRVGAIAPVKPLHPDYSAYLGALAHTAGTPISPILRY